jgi:ribonuclease Z
LGRVICLGTGAALNAERAQTSVAVRISDGETLLFDVSSGTIVLERLRGAGIPLQGIRHLFVSHRHFDHVGGLAPLLVAMVSLPEARLCVHALPGTLGALRDLLALTIPGVEDWLGDRLDWRDLAPEKPVLVGDAEVTPFLVDHSVECAGFRIVYRGTAVVFAADTRPCQEVLESARRAELLIHEVHGPAAEAETAHLMGHSTATEAGEIARAAGVDRLVLTHFREERFANPEGLAAEAASTFKGPVKAARDLDTFEF